MKFDVRNQCVIKFHKKICILITIWGRVFGGTKWELGEGGVEEDVFTMSDVY
jgi:hypothetical protein